MYPKYVCVVGIMKISNIAARAGIEPTYLAFRVSLGSRMLPPYPPLPVCVAYCIRGMCRLRYLYDCVR